MNVCIDNLKLFINNPFSVYLLNNIAISWNFYAIIILKNIFEVKTRKKKLK